MSPRIFVWVYLILVGGICAHTDLLETCKPTNNRPVIGVVAQESGTDPYLSKLGPSFFPSSYVKFIQQAGALVVPIKIDMPEDYYKQMFKKINGVLYPGGDANITTSGYARVGRLFYKYAMEAFDAGDYFPMWGTCLGFELLTALVLKKDRLEKCDDMDISLSLTFLPDFRKSRMFRHMPEHLVKILATENVTSNFHYYCLTPKLYESTELIKFYRIMSTNLDKKGLKFISSMEARKYPFYGTQFHPEKNNFIFHPGYDLTHSLNSALVSQYFANFFVNEARKSQHKFDSVEELGNTLINNIQPHFTGPPKLDEYYILDVGPVPAGKQYVNVTGVH